MHVWCKDGATVAIIATIFQSAQSDRNVH